ncbi:MAG: T9SS type A sorting domain-containing protein, partial [Ekhidna sp.]
WAFQLLYLPTDVVSETTSLTVVSNAINNNDVSVNGFGVGIKSGASIDVSISSIEETLVVSDSSEHIFTVTNTGTDTLQVALSPMNFSFESNKNPIKFSQAKAKNDAIVEKNRDRVNKYLAPEKTFEEQSIAYQESKTNELLRDYYGVVYQSISSEFSQVITSQFNYVNPIISVSNYGFTMASEFLPGSENEVLNLSYLGQIYTTNIEDRSSYSFGSPIFGDDDWTGLSKSLNSNFFYASTLKSLYRLDINTNAIQLIGKYNSSISMIGIAMMQNGKLYGYDLDDQFYQINTSTGNADPIGYIGFDASLGQDLAYDQNSNQLIMSAYNRSSNRSELRKVDIQTGNTELLGTIGANLSNPQGASIAFLNDLSTYFVKLDTNRVALAPGESSEVSVTLNASNLSNGKYTAEIQMLSNDYSNPKIDIPVSLEVTGNNASVGFFTDKINYGLHTVKSIINESVVIENVGKEVLTLVLEKSTDPFLSDYTLGDTVLVDIDDRLEFLVTFYPHSADVFDEQMVWSTNDPEMPEISIRLTAASERSNKELLIGFEQYHIELPRSSSEDIFLQMNSVGQDTVDFSLVHYDSIDWLAMDTLSMNLAPDSLGNAQIIISTEGLEIGSYETQLLLTSDDPMYDTLLIPISLLVMNQEIDFFGKIPNEPLAIGEEISRVFLNEHFKDEDADSLVYNVKSINGSVDIQFDADTLIFIPVSYGLDTINISAMDQFGDTLSIDVALMANNRPISSSIDPQFSRIDQSIVDLFSLNEYFSDTDGNLLTYQIELDEPIADLIIDSDDHLIINPEIVGNTIVNITAFDGFHYHSESFELTVSERSFKEISVDLFSYETTLARFEDKIVPLTINSLGQSSVYFSLSSSVQTDWLEMDSVNNMVLEPDSSYSTSFIIKTHDLEIGFYESSILLISDDPLSDSLNIPITLEVYNKAIESSKEILTNPLAIGEESLRIILSDYFYDGDADSLVYDASSTNGSIEVDLNENSLTLKAASFGLDTINVNAMDQHGDTLSINFELMSNTRPTTSFIDSQFSRMDQSIVALFDLNEYFSDTDGNILTYQIEQNEVIADLIVDSDDNLIMNPEIIGTTIVNITAFDGFHFESGSFELTVGKPLGIHDEITASFQLYPVPASNELTLTFDGIKKGVYEYRVIDLSGRVLLSQIIENISATAEEHIQIDKLQSGYYVIQLLINDEALLTRNFIKK